MKPNKTLTLGEIAEFLGAELRGDRNCVINGINTLQSAGAGDISFLANPAYAKHLPQTQASAVILRATEAEACPCNALILANPYLGYARLSRRFERQSNLSVGVDPSARIHPSVQLGEGCSIGPGVVIEAGAVIGAGTRIDANTFVGEDAVLGAACHLYPNVSIYAAVCIGDRVLIHSGTVIGADGFGFANEAGRWERIAQLGSVQIGNDVVIGACTTIDRGALDDTVIEEGVILDNQIQIAHNVRIGAHTAVAACAGISGSTQIGRHCVIAGGVGIVGHVEIADQVQVTGMTMVTHSLKEAGVYSSGVPIEPNARWRKNAARFKQLDDLARRLRQLEKQQQASS